MDDNSSETKGTLIFFCGKMAAGKSTLARKTASETSAVVLSEDDWLASAYPREIHSISDYLEYSSRLKPRFADLLEQILSKGLTVLMDFPANTRAQRRWFREIIDTSDCSHKLVFLDATDETCLARLRRRAQTEPERARFDTEATFRAVTAHFQPPSPDEGFVIERIPVR